MKKLSKLMALLMALMLFMSTCVSAMAESLGDVIKTLEEYYAEADDVLQQKILSFDDYTDYWDMIKHVSEEDFKKFYTGLSEEDQQYMAETMEALFWDSCISYTRVGPFLPAVDVSNAGIAQVNLYNATARSGDGTATVDESTEETENGLIINKTATANTDGTYTVTLDAYVTGTVTTETVTTSVPCDIVLVLDMSKSMDSAFGSTSRIAALKTAVTNFITSTEAKYDATKADHRISIVGYNSSASVAANWTFVDEAGSTSLQSTVTNMSQQMGTNTHLGLATANTQLTDDYNYTGKNTTRQKVVVLFTDGVPGTSANNFSESAAVTAIENAKTIKAGGATVYSVAIYDDADPTTAVQTKPGTNVLKINAMLHAISSNYPNATAESSGDTLTVTYGEGGNNGYYLTADSPEDLNDIFQTISSNIETGSASMTLGSTTVVQDVVSPYFLLPDGADPDQITITEAAYTGNDTAGNMTWGTAAASSATATIVDGKTLNITGFDFSDNAVMIVSGEAQGKKLIISFVVQPEPDFLGGNGVITNASAGVYTVDGSGNLVLVEAYEQPTVSVAVKELHPTVQDATIYLSNQINLLSLLKFDGDKFTLDGKTYYSFDGVNNAYVDVVYTYTDAAGNPVATYTIPAGATEGSLEIEDNVNLDLTEDTTYSITCTVKPTTTGTATATTYKSTGTVYVLKPVLTFQDTAEQYLSTVEADYYNTNNLVSTTWQGDSDAPAASGARPTVTLTYTPDEEGTLLTGTQVTSKVDVPVNVTVTLRGDVTGDYTAHSTSIRLACTCTGLDAECKHEADTTATAMGNNPEFVVHVYDVYGHLAITKTVENTTGVTPAVNAFTFTVTLTNAAGTALPDSFNYTIGETIAGAIASGGTITLTAGQTAIIEELPPDTSYTVTETVPTGYVASAVTTEGTITAGQTTAVGVTNTFKVADLTVTKSVVDPNGDPVEDYNIMDDVFTFKATIGGVETEFTLSPGEPKKFENIPINTTFTVEETGMPTGYSIATASQKVSGTMDADGESAHFTNTYSTGTLNVTKTVAGEGASTTQAFDFTVTFMDGKTALVGTYGNITLENGAATFQLKHGETKTFDNLPQGVTYTVVETEHADYTMTKTGDTGTITATASTAAFTNTYKTGSLSIAKVVSAADGVTPYTNAFTFQVTIGGQPYSGSYTVGSETRTVTTAGVITLAGGETAIIANIPVHTAYSVTETPLTGFNTAITMVDNGTAGKIDAQMTDALTFTNTYSTGTLTISKTVVGVRADKTKDFTFTVNLYADAEKKTVLGGSYTCVIGNETTQVSNGSTLTLKHGETATISNLPQGAIYTVTETEDPAYTMTNKTGDTGTISETASEAKFTNTLKVGTLTIFKEAGENTSFEAGETFQFTIPGLNLTVQIPGEGSITIMDVPLGEYTVTENTAWSPRYTVEDSASKTATLSEAQPNATVTFTNTLENNKWLDGNTYAENTFNDNAKVSSTDEDNANVSSTDED